MSLPYGVLAGASAPVSARTPERVGRSRVRPARADPQIDVPGPHGPATPVPRQGATLVRGTHNRISASYAARESPGTCDGARFRRPRPAP